MASFKQFVDKPTTSQSFCQFSHGLEVGSSCLSAIFIQKHEVLDGGLGKSSAFGQLGEVSFLATLGPDQSPQVCECPLCDQSSLPLREILVHSLRHLLSPFVLKRFPVTIINTLLTICQFYFATATASSSCTESSFEIPSPLIVTPYSTPALLIVSLLCVMRISCDF